MAYNPFNEIQRLKKQVSYLYKKLTCFIEDCCIKRTSELINDGEDGVNPFITQSDNFDRIINGNVFWVENLDFSSTSILYRLNGQEYTAPVTDITLSPADPLLPRIDLFAVDVNSQLIVIEGTPNANPQEPTLQFGSQLRVTTVLIPAASTTPDGFSDEIVYAENTEEPNEWNNDFISIVGIPGTNELVFDAENPDTGTFNITADGISPTSVIRFTNNEKTDLTTLSSLNFRFRSRLSFNYQCNIYIYNGNVLVRSITINNNEYDFTTTTSLVYNTVSIPLSDFTQFNLSEVEFDTISFSFNQVLGNTRPPLLNPVFDMDNIRLLFGGEIQNNNLSFLELSDTPNSYTGEAGKYPQVNQTEDGLEFVELQVAEYTLSPISGTNTVDLLKDGTSVSTIDLTPYLDDTNLARLVSGTLNPTTGILTVTRDDTTTFDIDLSDLIDIQVQSDWEETDNTNPAFILNKPTDYTLISSGNVITNAHGVYLRDDGLKVYVSTINNNSVPNEGGLYEYTMTRAFDFSTATLTNTINSVNNQIVTQCQDIHFSDDGLNLFVVNDSNRSIFQYNLSTAWDISTISTVISSIVLSTSAITSLTFSNDGKSFFTYRIATNDVVKYNLTEAWDISNVDNIEIFNNPFILNSQLIDGLSFSNQGTILYATSRNNSNIFEWGILREPYNINTYESQGALTDESIVNFNLFSIDVCRNNDYFATVRGTNLWIYRRNIFTEPLGYIPEKELIPIATNGLSVRNSNNIEEFNTQEEIQFQGFDFDPVNKRIINNPIIANRAYVDFINGDDSIAELQNFDRPFATLSAAYAAIPNIGYTIEIVNADANETRMGVQIPAKSFTLYSELDVIFNFQNLSGNNATSGNKTYYFPNGELRLGNNGTTTYDFGVGATSRLIIDVDTLQINNPGINTNFGCLKNQNGNVQTHFITCNTLNINVPTSAISLDDASNSIVTVKDVYNLQNQARLGGRSLRELNINTLNVTDTSSGAATARLYSQGFPLITRITNITGTGNIYLYGGNHGGGTDDGVSNPILFFDNANIDSSVNLTLMDRTNIDLSVRGNLRGDGFITNISGFTTSNHTLRFENFIGKVNQILQHDKCNLRLTDSYITTPGIFTRPGSNFGDFAILSIIFLGNNTIRSEAGSVLTERATPGSQIRILGEFNTNASGPGTNVTYTIEHNNIRLDNEFRDYFRIAGEDGNNYELYIDNTGTLSTRLI